MYSECYANIAAFWETYDANQAPSDEKWRVFCCLGRHAYLMVQNISGEVKFAPLFIYSFPLLAPHHLLESEKFNIRFTDPSEITEVADKLRWYRYHKALLQREVADYIEIDRSTYIRYEEYGRDYYPIENMEKLAALFGVPVMELLDDYNLFLYNDQGKQIREKRLALSMTQCEYAKMLGVQLGNLKKWEQNKARIFKSTWERHFK